MKTKLLSTGLSWLWITILILILDRISKIWMMNHLTFATPQEILPIFNLTLFYNTGAAFSFLNSASGWQNIFLGSLAVIVSAVILFLLYKTPRRAYWVDSAFCLVIGGALGNAWDRILYAHVIDFFDFHLHDWHFAIFNVADSAISVGAVMLLLAWIKENYKEKKNEK